MSNRSLVRPIALAVAVASLAAGCRTSAFPATVQGVATPKVAPPRAGRGSVVGVVADSASGYPVVGGSVYFTRDTVVGTGVARARTDLPRATTDRSGGFVLRDLPPGEYTLAFSDLDHVPMRVVVIVRADQTHVVTLRPQRRGTP